MDNYSFVLILGFGLACIVGTIVLTNFPQLLGNWFLFKNRKWRLIAGGVLVIIAGLLLVLL